MLEKLIKSYRHFHDDIVLNINYNISGSTNQGKIAIVELQSMNYEVNEPERIRVFFEDVIKFRFFESKKICSTVIFEAFIEKDDNGIIIFDFFSLQVNGIDKLSEDPNSSFVIHCNDIRFEKA